MLRTGRLRSVAAVLVLGLVALPVPAGAGGSDPKAPRFVDGQWDGLLDYTGQLGTVALVAGNGQFTMSVAGGVPSGTFSYLLAGTGSAGIASADLTFGGSGTIGGEATQPLFRIVSSGFSGEGAVPGLTVPIQGPTTIAGATFPLHVVLASCAQVEGSFSEEAEAAVNQAGSAVATNGYFVATRQATAPPGTLDAINEVLVKLDAILDAAVNGALDTAALLEVVKQAENVAASLPGNAKCGLVKKPDTFHLAISSRIADLLDYVLFAADDFTTNDLVEILYAGVQVGAIGAGASDQAFSKKVLGNLEQVLAARLQTAIANGDKAELEDIFYAAVTFGFDGLAQKAKGK